VILAAATPAASAVRQSQSEDNGASFRCTLAAAANLRDALTRTLDMVNDANLAARQFPDGVPALRQ